MSRVLMTACAAVLSVVWGFASTSLADTIDAGSYGVGDFMSGTVDLPGEGSFDDDIVFTFLGDDPRYLIVEVRNVENIGPADGFGFGKLIVDLDVTSVSADGLDFVPDQGGAGYMFEGLVNPTDGEQVSVNVQGDLTGVLGGTYLWEIVTVGEPVPEPASAALVGLGLLGLLGVRRVRA